ncbi:MAG: 3-hydroxy-3-methylglutaryl coenzyme A reductase [Myxococcales bacterium]
MIAQLARLATRRYEVQMRTSRISGFYKLPVEERLSHVQRFAGLTDEDVATLLASDSLSMAQADRMIENVGGLFHLPVGFAANFRIDDEDVLVPMVIEEPSVVAASSNAARMMREGRGIETSATAPVMVGQIQVCNIPNLPAAEARVLAAERVLLEHANAMHPRLLARGGGARRISLHTFPDTAVGPMLVVHIHVDVQDAMGANLINSMAEGLAEPIETLTGGEVNLRILSNLADERLVHATGRIPLSMLANRKLGLSGEAVADRVVSASVFAEVDPHRAATHNKGFMNGVDAVLLATGQDWRAVEAGAHAYASRSGRYTALSTWRREDEELVGRVTMPMQVGTVGGVTKVHPVVRVLLKVLGVDGAGHLGRIAAAVGLAQNLAAILALATEGIQRGHMSLHARNIAASAGASDEQIDQVVSEMVRTQCFTHETAELLVKEICR